MPTTHWKIYPYINLQTLPFFKMHISLTTFEKSRCIPWWGTENYSTPLYLKMFPFIIYYTKKVAYPQPKKKFYVGPQHRD